MPWRPARRGHGVVPAGLGGTGPCWPRPQPEDLFEIIFTSGTTGNPKGVMLTHRMIAETVGAIHHVIPPQEHRLVSLLPLRT